MEPTSAVGPAGHHYQACRGSLRSPQTVGSLAMTIWGFSPQSRTSVRGPTRDDEVGFLSNVTEREACPWGTKSLDRLAMMEGVSCSYPCPEGRLRARFVLVLGRGATKAVLLVCASPSVNVHVHVHVHVHVRSSADRSRWAQGFGSLTFTRVIDDSSRTVTGCRARPPLSRG